MSTSQVSQNTAGKSIWGEKHKRCSICVFDAGEEFKREN